MELICEEDKFPIVKFSYGKSPSPRGDYFVSGGVRLGPFRPPEGPIEDGQRMPPMVKGPKDWDGGLKKRIVCWRLRNKRHSWGIYDLLAQKYHNRRFGTFRFKKDATECDLDADLSKIMVDVGKWAVGFRFGRF